MNLKRFFIKKSKSNTQSGFTLIEMIIVVVIFGILTAVVVFNYTDFNNRIILTNMAYELALTTRQAQVFGLGTRSSEIQGRFNVSPDIRFEAPFGMYFDISVPSKAKTFNMFIDIPNSSGNLPNKFCNTNVLSSDCACDFNTGDECVEKFTMQRNIKIKELWAYTGNGGSSCTSTKKLAISFDRPNLDAVIYNQENRNDNNNGAYSSAQITIESPGGFKSYVYVSLNGQITVDNNPVCP